MKFFTHGMTLLETLLVIIIGATIIIVGVRYFSEASTSVKVTHAMDQIRTLTKASYQWLNAQKQANFSHQPNGVSITLNRLISAGLVDATHYSKDPWGGSISVAPGSNSSYVKITLTDISTTACLQLARRLTGVSHSTQNTNEDCKQNASYYGEF